MGGDWNALHTIQLCRRRAAAWKPVLRWASLLRSLPAPTPCVRSRSNVLQIVSSSLALLVARLVLAVPHGKLLRLTSPERRRMG